jgi:hypothetical protein
MLINFVCFQADQVLGEIKQRNNRPIKPIPARTIMMDSVLAEEYCASRQMNHVLPSYRPAAKYAELALFKRNTGDRFCRLHSQAASRQASLINTMPATSR